VSPSLLGWTERRVWGDPLRKQRTLLSFASTEEDGGRDLARAARLVREPELRAHLERHSRDEARHAELFRRRAAEVAREHGLAVGGEDAHGRNQDLSSARGGIELEVHGALGAGRLDQLGELEYVAMLHVAETKAARLFAAYRDWNARDPATRAVFEEILKDEKYHVAYTGKFLDRWRQQGRRAEVERALGAVAGSRLIGAWKRLGLRSAGGFSLVVLQVLYWTLLAPFGLLARSRAVPRGWQRPRGSTGQH
jgi:rubrerythrin